MRRSCWPPTELSPRSSPNTCCSRDRPETRGPCRLCTRPRSAARKGAPAAAVRYLRRALDVADSADPPPEVLVDLCLAEASAGEFTSFARFAQALQHIPEPEQRADALFSLGQTLYRFGLYTDAGTVFRRGAALFEDGDPQVRLRFEAAAFGAEYHLPPEQHGPLSAADGTGPAIARFSPFMPCANASWCRLRVRAPILAIRALLDGRCSPSSPREVPSSASPSLRCCIRVVWSRLTRPPTPSWLDARDRGAPMAYAEASLVRALVLLARGRCHRRRGRCPDGAGPHGMACTRSTAAATLANCMIERRELTEAASVLDSVQEIPPPVDVPGVDAYVYLARSRLHLGLRDIEAARKISKQPRRHCRCSATPTRLRFRGDHSPALSPTLALTLTRGNVLIQEEIRLAQRYEVPIALCVALRLRAITERGQEALYTLRQAIASLESTERSSSLRMPILRCG